MLNAIEVPFAGGKLELLQYMIIYFIVRENSFPA